MGAGEVVRALSVNTLPQPEAASLGIGMGHVFSSSSEAGILMSILSTSVLIFLFAFYLWFPCSSFFVSFCVSMCVPCVHICVGAYTHMEARCWYQLAFLLVFGVWSLTDWGRLADQ